MVDNNNAVATPNPLASMLAKYKKAVQSVLPKHLTPERILRIAHMAISRNPKLMGCTQQSLINGIIQSSVLGLEIGTGAHLVPFFNNRIKQDEAVFIPDYKGLIDLAHRSGRIQSYPFKPVYQRDEFSYSEGTDRHIKHVPCREEDRGELVAAYAIVFYKHGGYDFEVVERADAMAAKAKSRGAKKKDSPWNDPSSEWTMWCKTAVKRLTKRVPQSPELQFASQAEDVFDATGAQLLDIDVIPMDAITDGSDGKPQYEVKDAPEEPDTPGEPETDGSPESSQQDSTAGTQEDPLKPSSPAPGKTAKETAQEDAGTENDGAIKKCKDCGRVYGSGEEHICEKKDDAIYAVCSSCNERFDTAKGHKCKPQEEEPSGAGEDVKMYTLVGKGGGTKSFEFHDMLKTVTGKKDIEPTWEAYGKYANGKKPTTYADWAKAQVKMGVWKYCPADIVEKLLKKYKRFTGFELEEWTKAGEGGPATGADLNEDPTDDPGLGTDKGWEFPLEMSGDADLDEAIEIINDLAETDVNQLHAAMANGATDPNDGTVYPACPEPSTVDDFDNIIMAFHAITRINAAAA